MTTREGPSPEEGRALAADRASGAPLGVRAWSFPRKLNRTSSNKVYSFLCFHPLGLPSAALSRLLVSSSAEGGLERRARPKDCQESGRRARPSGLVRSERPKSSSSPPAIFAFFLSVHDPGLNASGDARHPQLFSVTGPQHLWSGKKRGDASERPPHRTNPRRTCDMALPTYVICALALGLPLIFLGVTFLLIIFRRPIVDAFDMRCL